MHEDASPPSREGPSEGSRKSAVLLGLAAGTGLLTAATLPFLIIPWLPRRVFGALPYMHTPEKKLRVLFDNLLPQHLASRCTASRFLDMGSGSGEAVLEAARRGFIAEGVELNPTLHIIASIRGYAWWLSRRLRPEPSRVASEALGGGGGVVGQGAKGSRWEASRPRFHLGNMFQVQLAPYDVVMVFGVEPLMARIASKLKTEAQEGCLVVSYRFAFPADAVIADQEDQEDAGGSGSSARSNAPTEARYLRLLKEHDELLVYQVSESRVGSGGL